MFTHTQIWQGIDRLASSFGYSPSGLARQAGLDPTSFNKSKRVSPDGKPRWPSTESISKVLAVTGATMSDFIALIDGDATQKKPLAKKKMAQETAQILIETESVLFNAKKPFTLKSGRKSPVYVDMRRLLSFTRERGILMDFAVDLINREIGDGNIHVIAGGETAGIPYAALIAERMHKPMVYVRKVPKGHGRHAQVEGVLPGVRKKTNVLLVEDLQTDGGSKKVFVDALRKAKTTVKHGFVIFHYGIYKQSDKNMKSLGLKLHALATWHDVLDVTKKEKYFDKATLKAVESFLKKPESWKG